MTRHSFAVCALLALAPIMATGLSAAADECGCGGPKAYYVKLYGSVKPPQFQAGATTAGAAAAPAGTAATAPAAAPAAPVNPPSTGSGG